MTWVMLNMTPVVLPTTRMILVFIGHIPYSKRVWPTMREQLQVTFKKLETDNHVFLILILFIYWFTFTFSDWSEMHVIKLICTINFWQEDVHHWLTCRTKIIKYSNSWVKESISMDICNTLIRNPPWWSNGNQYLINNKKGR